MSLSICTCTFILTTVTINLFCYNYINFFQYLQSTNVSNHTFMDMFQGISFLPLENCIHLYAQSFLNVIENKFHQVNYSMLLYNDSLVW